MNSWTSEIEKNWYAIEIGRLNRFVSVDYERLRYDVVDRHRFDKFVIPNWRFAGVYPEREWAYAANCLAANCFNAAYNIPGEPDAKFSISNPNDSGRPYDGAFAMYRALYSHFGERIIQASDLRPHVETPAAMSLFFDGIKKVPFPELKARCGLDYVVGLEQHFQGNPLNLIEEATVWDDTQKRNVIRAFNDGKGLVELLIDKFPVAYGEDVQELYGYKFPFYKRAQLAAVLLHGRSLDSRGILPSVFDICEIGPIADYEVPKSLRHLGILKFSDELAHAVDNWIEILKDSEMEVEIRAAMTAAIRKMMTWMKAQKYGESLNICHIDYWLWKTGKEAKHLRPHLTRTSAY